MGQVANLPGCGQAGSLFYGRQWKPSYGGMEQAIQTGWKPVHVDDRARAFVAERGRVFDDLVADAAVDVVVDVGAAHAHAVDPHQHVARPLKRRHGALAISNSRNAVK